MSYVEDVPTRATSANMPELAVEWLPTCGPGVSDGDWCDITEYVTTGNTSRGRQYELDAFKAGTCSLTLETFTRLFDPEYAAGPFYPWLTPMRQLRVSAVWAGTRYPIFRGYITSWGQTQPSDKMFVTTLSVRDGFERLEQLKLPSSAWALEIQKDDPDCWLRLGESDTVRVTDSSPGGNYGIYDNCQQGAQGLVVNDADGAVSFAHSLEERVVIQNPNLITGYPFTFSCMFKVDGSEPGGQKVLFTALTDRVPSNFGSGFVIGMGRTGDGVSVGAIFVWARNDGLTSYFLIGTPTRYDDDRPHHLAVACSGATSMTIYVDGVNVTGGSATAGSPAWPGSPPNGWVVGNYTDLLSGDFGFGANADGLGVSSQEIHPGTIDEVCVWDGTIVTATRIAAHSAAALVGWEGDTTGARVTRFLDALGWPTTLRDIDTGISVLGPADWSEGSTALSAMQGWADTETGQFVMGTNGEIVWKSRHAPLLDANAVTSQATFSDTHSGGLKCDVIDLRRDATLIRNPVIASRRNGVSVKVSDEALIDDKYGDRTWAAPNTEDQKDSAVRDRAMWLLARYKEQGTRLAGLTITPTQDSANLFPVALGLPIGDRVTVNRTPLGMGAAIDVDQILEGVDHAFTPFTWTTSFVGSPVDPNVGNYLILDDPVYGLLDQQLLAY